MSKALIAIIIVIMVVGILAFSVFSWGLGTYNRFIGLKTKVEEQQGQIEAQLQRRFDLIPNLVNSVKGMLVQEQAVFGAIAEARTRYAGTPSGGPEKIEAAYALESALGRLLVIIENYPELRSVETVQELMAQLEGTENRISVARQRYNEVVKEYNQSIRVVPNKFIATLFHFEEMTMFGSVPEAKVVPEVNLDIGE